MRGLDGFGAMVPLGEELRFPGGTVRPFPFSQDFLDLPDEVQGPVISVVPLLGNGRLVRVDGQLDVEAVGGILLVVRRDVGLDPERRLEDVLGAVESDEVGVPDVLDDGAAVERDRGIDQGMESALDAGHVFAAQGRGHSGEPGQVHEHEVVPADRSARVVRLDGQSRAGFRRNVIKMLFGQILRLHLSLVRPKAKKTHPHPILSGDRAMHPG